MTAPPPPGPPPDPHSVVITPTQIYAELRSQSDLLVRIWERLEQGRYEERIRALERARWLGTGAAGAIGGAAGWLAQAIGG